ncbi:IS4 family transposase [Pseudoduganella sp. LjRoot289]
MASAHWAANEFAQLDLGDARLNKRARTLMERFAADPVASIPDACHGWGETMAAYRFLGNEAVDWRDIMAPHWEQTRRRMQEHPVMLCLQDTTELNFNGQETEGLGPLSYEAQRGMYLHPTYAVTPAREALGVLDAWMWARTKKDDSGKRGGPKESLRWVEGYDRIAEMAADFPHTRLVYLADREADLMPLMRRAQELGAPADWLIRAAHNRCLPDGGKLWDHTTAGPVLGEIAFTMASRHGVKARPVRQQLWAQRIELPAGKGRVAVTCIVAREIDAPKGAKPVEWRLLTNRQATSRDEVIELIDWYRARWEIEMLFDILKNACRIEALQLSQAGRLERAIAMYLVVAWRVAHLMRLGRTCPDLDATQFFDRAEIQAAYMRSKGPPPASPRLNEVLRLIAGFGGFLARKGDGEPGVKAIWNGLRKVRMAAEAIRAVSTYR